MSQPLVSIIMAAYNAETYISDAIQSVFEQDHENFELIIVNDGSSDRTENVILSFTDNRIRYFSQMNKGVSEARNVGLQIMQGEFFCFLDSDDRMPFRSLSSRLAIFQQSENVYFVDGKVEKWNGDFSTNMANWEPGFRGRPLQDLITLTGQSFFGPTWLIRKHEKFQYLMKAGLTHGEDLLFYMELARQLPTANYDFTNETVLYYRVHSGSAMHSLNGLERGYRIMVNEMIQWNEVPDQWKRTFQKKTRWIMSKSYLRNGELIQAIRAVL